MTRSLLRPFVALAIATMLLAFDPGALAAPPDAPGPPATRSGALRTGADSALGPQTATSRSAVVPVVATLPTGERVTMAAAPSGAPEVTLDDPAAAPGPSTAITTLVVGSHVYAIPFEASPLVGRGLDLSLFDVARLAAAERGGRSPSLTASGRLQPAPAGLAWTDGRLTVTDPAAFGASLARWRSSGGAADLASSPLHGLRLSLAGGASAALAAPLDPGVRLYTVTVKGIDRAGKPDNGDLGVVTNVQDTDRFIAGQSFYRGRFRFSVPAGTYNVDSFIATSDQRGVSFTLAANPQFEVHADTTVTLDARDGTKLSVSTPRPSAMIHGELNFQRNPATGVSFTDGLTTFGDATLYAVPTQQVTVGQAYFYPDLRLGDASGSIDHYLYDLEMPTIGRVPSRLHYTVSAADLATVHARYASVLPGTSEEEDRLGLLPWQATTVGSVNPLIAPLARTEYVSARPRLEWFQEVDLDPNDGLGRTLSPVSIYAPGSSTDTLWDNQPMGAGVEQQHSVPQGCPACRSNDVMSFSLMPHVDATNNFMLVDQDTTEDLTLYENGTQIGETPAGAGAFEVSQDPASYRLVYDTATTAPWFPTSTHVTTAWTFDSKEQAQGHLPPGWTCSGKAPDPVNCVALPLLLPHLTTSAGLDGVIPAGHEARVLVRVTPQRGAGADPLTDVTGTVSYDGGTHWQAVAATRVSSTVYRLSYQQPRLGQTDGFASLRFHAAAQSGSSVAETITHAYPLKALAGPTAAPLADPATKSSVDGGCAEPRPAPLTNCEIVVAATGRSGAKAPKGLTPADLVAAYRLPRHVSGHPTVAIVVPYDDPSVAADLATYRAEFGLPACTVTSGCLTTVNEHGRASPLPPASPGWALLTAVQADAVSATCPVCKLLVVETDTDSMADVGPGLTTAARLGADVVVTGYGTTGEFAGEKRFEPGLAGLGVPFVAASGDYGYGNGTPLIGSISYPSASTHAIAVGGTTLTAASNARGFTETAWADTTSGCSAYIAKPAWQHDPACGRRTTADVAAVGDPSTGLATYDSYQSPGWQQIGGTGLSAGIIAGVYGLASGAGHATDARSLYRPGASLFDVTSGSNGTCKGSYLCTARTGYDGPSGVGTPDGIGAF